MSNGLGKISRNQREAQAVQILMYNTHIQAKLDEQQGLIYATLLKIAEKLGVNLTEPEEGTENVDTQSDLP